MGDACAGAEVGKTVKEEVGSREGLDVDEEVVTDETTEERSTASRGLFRTAIWTAVGGVGGVIGRIATALFGRATTADKTYPVRKNLRI